MLLSLPSPYSVTKPAPAHAPSSGAELVTTDGRSLPLVGAVLTGDARGGIARLVLEQKFVNTYAEALHVTYRMPLPADGAVSAYAFVIADRTIAGRVEKKADAREQFERALVEGKTAALLEQNRDDIFTQEIGNIPAGEAIVARITVDMRLVWLVEGEWELRFPTVIGPRYVGSADTPDDAAATHLQVTDAGIAARIAIAIRIGDAITGARGPSSPTHGLVVKDGAVELRSDAGARLDRDIVVRWPVAGAQVGLALDASCDNNGAHGLLTIVPPARAAKAEAIARDLIILLDTSGSMGGGPLDTAKRVLAHIIESLGEGDRLELIEFSSTPRRYLAEPVAATARAKRDAIDWVMSRQASGGTEMRAGVLEALRTLRRDAQRQVIVVTDGYVGGEQQILAVLGDKLPASCRLHVLGVGSAVNRSLALSLSRAGRGCEVLAGIDEDSEKAAGRLIARTRAPMLSNVRITGSALVACAPANLPDVFEGAPLVAALALDPAGGELVVTGVLATGRWEKRIDVPAIQPGEGNPAIAALYAREQVADLEIQAAMGVSVDREIETVGLRYQIATRMTSWIAVDESRKVEGPRRRETMPQELPYGTSAAAFGLRAAGRPMAHAGYAQMEAGAYAMDTLLAGPPAGPPPAEAPMAGRVSSYTTRDGIAPSAAPMQRGPRIELHDGVYSKRRRPRFVLWLVALLVVAGLGWLVWWLFVS
jgi:Ca-activated chloride channel homolog